jgi:soluble lytic murein transglycosylase-like protein
MQRLLLVSMLLTGLGALSCQPIQFALAPTSLLDSLGAGLPAISDHEASARDIAAYAAPESLAEALATIEIDPEELAALTFLRERHTGLSDFEEESLARTIIEQARRNDLEVTLVLAVIRVESGGYSRARSPVGALGLMQLLPSTAEEVALRLGEDWRGAESLFDPELNVTLGMEYLKRLSDRYGSVQIALAAYNWGPGRIDRRMRNGHQIPSIYIEQVMKAYDATTNSRS